ncbi:MAG TPA: Rnf-Nqr domain containing protein [Pseudomonas sp.]|jgi:electron transport complex protein RnfE
MTPIANPARVFLLGPLSLAPLIGVTDGLIKAIGFLLVLGAVGLLHFVLMQGINLIMGSTFRRLAGAIIAATLVSIAGLLLQARALELYQALGIYLPIVGIQCLLLQDIPTELSANTRKLVRGAGYYSAAILALGTLRELLGDGSLLNNAQWLFGSNAASWRIDLLPSASGVHLMVLAPGGFILSGLLMAAVNALRQRQ